MPISTKPAAEPAARKKAVFIVDDHPVVRQGLSHLIAREADLAVCGEGEDAHGALNALARSRPDVVVVDLSLKDGSGLELVRDVKERFPALPVLVLTTHDESVYGERALKAGARGYVMKAETSESLITAIRRVLNGGIHVSDALKLRLLENYAGGGGDASPVERLSDRELEVFRWLGRGWGTRQIAGKLCVSIKTVETYRGHIKDKLDLPNAAQLVRRAVQWVQESEDLPTARRAR